MGGAGETGEGGDGGARPFINSAVVAPFWRQITWKLSGLSPYRDCSTERVERMVRVIWLLPLSMARNIGTVGILISNLQGVYVGSEGYSSGMVLC